MNKKFVALISGGKDSFYSIDCLLRDGFILEACIHIKSSEIDSYMYQTAGQDLIHYYKNVLDVPVYIFDTNLNALNKELEYNETKNDEVEVIFESLQKIKEKHNFQYVCSGAIKSTYQYNRIKNVCDRLNLISLTPLFNLDQHVLFNSIRNTLTAIFVKIATSEISQSHIGQDISSISHFKIDNMCGEGGEYETLVLDAPFFKKKLKLRHFDIGYHPEEINKEKTVFFLENASLELIDKN